MNFFKRKEGLSVKRTPDSKKKSEFVIDKKTFISKGGFFATEGVHSASVHAKGDKKKREVPVVIKQYGEDHYGLFDGIAKVHAQMKKDGLKVPRTLRYDVKNKRTVMTDFNQGDRIALSHTNASELASNRSFESMPGFKFLMQNMIEHAVTAAQKGYQLTKDSYLILMPRNGEDDLDFVIGDFDIVKKIDFDKSKNPSADKEELLQSNLRLLASFMGEFCMYWLKDYSTAETYIVQANEMVNGAIEDLSYKKAA